MFLFSEGRVEVSRDDKYLSTLAPGKVLGELAILYNCKRTATIKGKFRILLLTASSPLLFSHIFANDLCVWS
jgi:CRP-like cAMP-binding protein